MPQVSTKLKKNFIEIDKSNFTLPMSVPPLSQQQLNARRDCPGLVQSGGKGKSGACVLMFQHLGEYFKAWSQSHLTYWGYRTSTIWIPRVHGLIGIKHTIWGFSLRRKGAKCSMFLPFLVFRGLLKGLTWSTDRDQHTFIPGDFSLLLKSQRTCSATEKFQKKEKITNF